MSDKIVVNIPNYQSRSFEVTIREIGFSRKETTKWTGKANGDPGYEYTPPIEEVVEESKEIYKQAVPSEKFDLTKVILAVNKIGAA